MFKCEMCVNELFHNFDTNIMAPLSACLSL